MLARVIGSRSDKTSFTGEKDAEVSASSSSSTDHAQISSSFSNSTSFFNAKCPSTSSLSSNIPCILLIRLIRASGLSAVHSYNLLRPSLVSSGPLNVDYVPSSVTVGSRESKAQGSSLIDSEEALLL